MNRTVFAFVAAVLAAVLPGQLGGVLAAGAIEDAQARNERQRLELQRLRKEREKAREKSTTPAPRSRFTRRRSSRPAKAQDHLSLSLPPGWTETEQDGEAATAFAAWLAYRFGTALYRPEGQTAANGHEYIRVEQFKKRSAPGPGLDRAYRMWNRYIVAACERPPGVLSSASPVKGAQDGHPVIESVHACAKLAGLEYGAVIMMKAIDGASGLHVIIRQWRGPPLSSGASTESEAQINAQVKGWAEWSGRVRLGGGEEETKSQNTPAKGYGFHVSRQGHVLTNHSQVEDCRRLRFSKAQGKLLASDPVRNLALFRLRKKPKASGNFREEAEAGLGDPVALASYPDAEASKTPELSVSTGFLSALVGPGGDPRFVTITAPIPEGNSGLPIVDLSGLVAGMAMAAGDVQKTTGLTPASSKNTDYALGPRTLREFLESHGIPYETTSPGKILTPGQAAEKAREITVFVECWK